MRILSPAKINLHLRVGPLGSDGFHPILSWMCAVGLYDVMEMEPRDEPGVRLKCDRADVPTDEKNLIVRAGRTLDENRGANVALQKKIPMGGGLGGGSSNAAHALVAFNKLWDLDLPASRLAEIASRLGSDVPFFLGGPSSICTGRGQNVSTIQPPRPKHVVLIFPKMSISTPAVYRRFDEMKLGSAGAVEPDPKMLTWPSWSTWELLGALVNDLEAPTFSLRPELGVLRRTLETKIGRVVRMTGSGSTLFTLADEKEEADDLALRIGGHGVETASYPLAPEFAI
jgi:4-diphosphocytidyl-2-C-methyl-D-erythritol kinase